MIDLSQEYLNTDCQIHATNNMMIGMGKISTIEDNYLIISNTKEGFPVLKFLSYIKLILQNTVLGYKVILACVTESNPDTLRLSNLNLLTDNQRRGYFRVPVTIQTKLFLSESSHEVEKQYRESQNSEEAIMTIPSNNVTIKDLSLGGALIISDAFYQTGQKIVIKIKSRNKPQFFLMSIRRRYRDECDEDSPYQYGCVFNEKNNKKMDELCRLTLEIQSHIIKNVKQA